MLKQRYSRCVNKSPYQVCLRSKRIKLHLVRLFEDFYFAKDNFDLREREMVNFEG